MKPLPGDGAPPVFDGAALLHRLVGDEEIAREVVQIFLHDTPGRIARISAASASGDIRSLAEGLHSLKGAAATLGAEALRAKAEELETALREADVEALAAGPDSLRREFDRLRAALQRSELSS